MPSFPQECDTMWGDLKAGIIDVTVESCKLSVALALSDMVILRKLDGELAMKVRNEIYQKLNELKSV